MSRPSSLSPQPDDRAWRRLLLPSVLLVLLVGAAPVSADTVRVLSDRAPILNSPGETGVVLTQAGRDDELILIRQVGDWYEVVLPGARGRTASAPTGFIRVSQAVVWVLEPTGRFRATGVRGSVGPERFLNVDVGYRIGGGDLVRTASAFADDYAETGSITTNYGNGSGVELDVMGGARVHAQLGIAGGFSYYARPQDAVVDAQVPHPFYFHQLRNASFDDATLKGREIGVHISLLWMPQWNRRQAFVLYGGPSFFHVSHGAVAHLDLKQQYPFDEVTITGTTSDTRSSNAVGFHVGADFSHFFTSWVGVGVGARYSRAAIDVDESADDSTTGVAGRPKVSGGLRFRF